eukprot:TRINITY_DN20305_c0_g1_i1.p1 TRINITY_DN20305_c0_g1~~TRINITY_DN20305_c0_g1_i1.p1  ORF type:complete len:1132 (+),score=363.39 TRINITY_DN20305_c0_g1_i1:59-3397(+)
MAEGEAATPCALLAAAGEASWVRRIIGHERTVTGKPSKPSKLGILARGNLGDAKATVLHKGLYPVDGTAAACDSDRRPVSAPATVSLGHANASMVAVGAAASGVASPGYHPQPADLSSLLNASSPEDLTTRPPTRSRLPDPIRTSTPPPDLHGSLRGAARQSPVHDAAGILRAGTAHDQFSQTERNIVARVNHLRASPDEFARHVVNGYPVVRNWDGWGAAALHKLNVTSPPAVAVLDPTTPADEILSAFDTASFSDRRKLQLDGPPATADALRAAAPQNGSKKDLKKLPAAVEATPRASLTGDPVVPALPRAPPLRALTFSNASRMRTIIEEALEALEVTRAEVNDGIEHARREVDEAENPPAANPKGKAPPKGKKEEKAPEDKPAGPSAEVMAAMARLQRLEVRAGVLGKEAGELEARLQRVEAALASGVNQVRCLFSLKPVPALSYSLGLSLSARECCVDQDVVLEHACRPSQRKATPSAPFDASQSDMISLADLPDPTRLETLLAGPSPTKSAYEMHSPYSTTPSPRFGKTVQFAPTPTLKALSSTAASPAARSRPGTPQAPSPQPSASLSDRLRAVEEGLAGSPRGANTNKDNAYGRALGNQHCVVALDPAQSDLAVESVVMDPVMGVHNIACLTDPNIHHGGCGWRRFEERRRSVPLGGAGALRPPLSSSRSPTPEAAGGTRREEKEKPTAVAVILLAGLYQDSHLVRRRKHLPLQTVHHELRASMRPPLACTFPITFFPCEAGGRVVKALAPTEHPVVCGNIADLYLQVPSGVTLCASLDGRPVPAGVQANYSRIFIQPAVGYEGKKHPNASHSSRPGSREGGGGAVVMHVQVRLPGLPMQHLHLHAAPEGGGRYQHIGSVMLACDARKGFRSEQVQIGYPSVTPELRSSRVQILSPLMNPLQEGVAYSFEIRVDPDTQHEASDAADRKVRGTFSKRQADQARYQRRLEQVQRELDDIDCTLELHAAQAAASAADAGPGSPRGKGKPPAPVPSQAFTKAPPVDVDKLNARTAKLEALAERLENELRYVTLQAAVARQEMETHCARGALKTHCVELASNNFNQNLPLLPAAAGSGEFCKAVTLAHGRLALVVDGICVAHWSVESPC